MSPIWWSCIQSACADLARLRAIGAEPDLVEPLNRLIIRAHGQVYRGAPASPWSLGGFFLRDYPRLFRRTWKFTFASFLISLVTALAAYWTVQDSPQTVADILGGNDREFYGEKSLADIRERFGHEGDPMLSSLRDHQQHSRGVDGVRPGDHIRSWAPFGSWLSTAPCWAGWPAPLPRAASSGRCGW